MNQVRLIFSGSEELKSGMIDDAGMQVVRMADLSRDSQLEVVRYLMTA